MFNWCCSQTGTNRKTYAPRTIFELLFSFKIFAAAAHLFQDLQKVPLGQPWLGIATDSYRDRIYKVQKSCDFHFYINPVPGATQKKMSCYCTGMETIFAQLNCLLLLFSYVCSLHLPVHWNVCIEVKSNGLWCIYVQIFRSHLFRFPAGSTD